MINNLPQIMLHTPGPLSHVAFDVILSMAANTAEKNDFTTCPFWPSVLIAIPNTKQNTTKPNVFGELRKANCRIKCMLVTLVPFNGMGSFTYDVYVCWNVAWKRFSGSKFLRKEMIRFIAPKRSRFLIVTTTAHYVSHIYTQPVVDGDIE